MTSHVHSLTETWSIANIARFHICYELLWKPFARESTCPGDLRKERQ